MNMNLTTSQHFSLALRSCVVALLVCLLAGCGFQLRGQRALPFHSIYLGMSPYDDLAVAIKRELRANNDTQVTDTLQEAQVNMVVLVNSKEKAILSLNSQGTVREYQLRQHFAFRLVDKAGLEVMPYNEINVSRDISFNDSQILAKEQEESLLYRDMQNDLVQQLMRRLSTAKLNTP
ncbi:MAG TPA: LPS assembly lipoprotein LptE [Rhodocyclaceae bacterium]|nr:LPS assembly lipoprotein LptE [Rhodocyclaceae bacterium]